MDTKINDWKSIPQRTKEWFEKRNKLLTASDIPAILEVSPFISKFDLFNKKLSGLREEQIIEENNPAIEWGQKYEPIAKEYYQTIPLALGKREVIEVGIITHPKYNFIGASPDGLVKSLDNYKVPYWLLEIKCPFKRNFHDDERTIPLYIWSQIQIQLEVCDLPFCHLLQCRYGENGVLINKKFSTIYRDSIWFKETAYPAIEEFWVLLQRALQYQFVNNPYPNPKEWISTKSFTGFLLSDPLLDFLEEYRNHPSISEYNNYISSKSREKNNLYCSLENNIVSFCKERNYEVIAISPFEEKDRESISTRRFIQTQKAVNNKIPVIFRPVLLNYGLKTYGIPDLIMRSDIALEYIKDKYDIDTSIIESSIKNFKVDGYIVCCFTMRNDLKKINNDVDFNISENRKFFSLPPNPGLRRSERNTNKVDYFEIETNPESKDSVKFKKWDKVLRARYTVYADIIDVLLPKKHHSTFVMFMGFSFCHICSPDTINSVRADINDAVSWVRRMRKEGDEWINNLESSPDLMLMPNMCNKYDQKWEKFKRILAERWGELTLLWYCGYEQRKKAHEKGIYSWKDPKFTAKEVVDSFYKGGSSNKRREIMKEMIKLNRTSDKVYSYKKCEEIPDEKNKEIFIDFEVLSNYDNSNSYPQGMIYMIGLGWIDKDNSWSYKSFYAEKLCELEEKRILYEWWNTIEKLKKDFNINKIVAYHWSPAEFNFLSRVHKRNPIPKIMDGIEDEHVELKDLMEMVLDAEVVIRGVWGYSVKDFAKGLYNYGLIPEIWELGEKGNFINSGENSITKATMCYNIATRYNTDISRIPDFSSLITYNQTDCRVLYDILNFLREHVYHKEVRGCSSPIITKTNDEIWKGKRKVDDGFMLDSKGKSKNKRKKKK